MSEGDISGRGPGSSRATALTTRDAGMRESPSTLPFEFLDELGDSDEQVCDEPIVGDLEDGCIAVLVDRDDYLRRLHPGDVLDRPGDADRDVELRRHGAPGLADLELRGSIAGIASRAAGTQRRPERVGQRFEDLRELLFQRATSGDDDARLAEVRPFALARLEREELHARGRGIVRSPRNILDRTLATGRLRRGKLGLSNAHDLYGSQNLQPSECIAGVHRAAIAPLRAFDLDHIDVRRIAGSELRRETRGQILAKR